MTLQQHIHEYTNLYKPVRDFEQEGYARELPRFGKAVFIHGLRVRDRDGCEITSSNQIG